MSLGIWIAIFLNVIIAGSLVAGIFIGKGDGIKITLCRLGSLLIGGVAAYFTAPLLTKVVSNIGFIQTALTEGFLTLTSINALLFALIILFAHLIGVIIIVIAQNIAVKKVKKTLPLNTAKPVKVQGLTKKDTIKLRKQQKKIKKAKEKQAVKEADAQISKGSKIAGAIFGVLYMIVMCFVMMLPLKSILTDISTIKPELDTLPQAYEYTAFGQLDSIIGVNDFLISMDIPEDLPTEEE